MQRVTRPREPDEEANVHAEGINYFDTGDSSIWGPGDEVSQEILRTRSIHGSWLDLAAGDGRYTSHLLRKADRVIASDIDESALSKLWHGTPVGSRHKLGMTVCDLTAPLPFGEGSFDGVFSASTLHYFPAPILNGVFSEIRRVLKRKGTLVVEFATDVRRVLPDGNLHRRRGEPGYGMAEATRLIEGLLEDLHVTTRESEVPPTPLRTERHEYTLSCRLLLVEATKP